MQSPLEEKTGSTRPRRSLRNKLLRSHFTVAGVGVLLLIVAGVGSLWARQSAIRLATLSAPLTQASEQVQTGLQNVLANLRGWMAVADPSFRKDRALGWSEEVWPATDSLERLSIQKYGAASAPKLATLRKTLVDLQEMQWYIEDVAQTPGNEPARVLMEQSAQSIIDHIKNCIDSIIDLEKKIDGNSTRKELLSHFADFRAFFLQSASHLASHVDRGQAADETESRAYFKKAEERLEAIFALNTLMTPQQQEYLTWIQEEFNAFEITANEIVALRQSDLWNVSGHYLAESAAPLARKAHAILTEIDETEGHQMLADARRVTMIGNLVPGLMLLLTIGMAFTAIWASQHGADQVMAPVNALVQASTELANGQSGEAIPVTSDDELGDLTAAYNTMRESLLRREEELRQSEERARGIVETAIDAIITIDERGIMQSCNPASEKLFGYQIDEMVGRNVSMLMPSPFSEEHDGYLRRYLDTGNSKIIGIGRAVTARNKNGESFPAFLSVGEVNLGGQRMFTGVVNDMTEWKKMDEEIRETNGQLERELKLQRELAGLDDALRGDQKLGELSENILEYLCPLMQSPVGTIFVTHDENKFRQSGNYACQKNEAENRLEVLIGEGLIGQAARERKIVCFDDIPASYLTVETSMGSSPPSNILVVPILHEGKVIAVVEFGSFHKFSEEEQQFFDRAMQPLGAAIDAAAVKQDYEDALRRAEDQAKEMQQQDEELRVTNEELQEQATAMKEMQARLEEQQEELRATNEEMRRQQIYSQRTSQNS